MKQTGLARFWSGLGNNSLGQLRRSLLGTRGHDEQPAHLLVVDPDGKERERIANLLRQAGHPVHTAASIATADALIREHNFELALAELDLPDGSAMDLTGGSFPVIALSARVDVTIAIDAMRQGAFDYLLRPVTGQQLYAAVDRAMEHRNSLAQRTHYQHNLEQMVRARTELLHVAMEELEHSYDITLEALGDALDLKDSETEGHSKRVTAYTIALARALGLPADQIRVIARGAFLHDIGKMAIPDEILRKPGKLSADEQVVMREHCARGYHMLRKIPFLRESAEIVYSHQEHYDGTGYPRRLSGNQIHIGARIFAIADTLDAITSDRPYRRAQSFDAARAEILRCSGTQFDPLVVDGFLKIPNELWHELRSEIIGRDQIFSSFNLDVLTSSPE